jgi:hypothetical protein
MIKILTLLSLSPYYWRRFSEIFLSEPGVYPVSFFFLKGSVMKLMTKTVAAAVLAGVSSLSMAFVPSVPPGWTLVKSLNTVKIYQENGKQNYMQVLNMSGGATIELKQEYAGLSQGLPAYNRYTIANWWTKTANPVSIVNGQFFFIRNPTPLSFPMRVNGTYIAGHDPNMLANPRQFEVYGNTVDTFPFNLNRIKNGPSQQVISGLHPSADKNNLAAVGRTSICARYVNQPSPWLTYIFTGQAETQANVRAKLTNWGCDVANKAVMLDGGGSTALAYNNGSSTPKIVNGIASGTPKIENRPVPQVIVVRGN